MGAAEREEESFCDKATKLLATHGIMVLVVPIKAFVGNRSFVREFRLPVRKHLDVQVPGWRR